MKIIAAIYRILSRYGWGATLVVLAGFAVGFTWSSSDALYDNIRLFDKAAITINSEYVENLNESQLIKAGIDGMLSKLDPYSKYLSDADFLYLKQETEGEFEGIGIALGFHHDTLTVESVMDGTPANKRGVIAGDRIVGIDDVSTANKNIREVKMMLRGQSGSTVTLNIIRPEIGLLKLHVEHEIVEIKAIPFYGIVKDNVGYIRLARFSGGCTGEIHDAIRNLKRMGMTSLILDLRDNPGGLLLESVESASMFLPETVSIVQTRGKGGMVGDSYISAGKPDFQVGGLVVLVDSLTASAAEILAGAIQDHDRGVIIGCSTFGKGLVQQVMQFTDDSALKLTTAKYYLPSGRCLQKPDWSTFELVKDKSNEPTASLYKTDSGRAVLGGGGIIPDIYIDGDALSPFVITLINESYIFDFSLAYLRDHTISPGFRVDSTTMAQFRQFLKMKKFQYENDERTAFIDLKQNLKEPSEKLKSALDIIDKELAIKETWEFESHYSEIAGQLREAMILQAFGETVLYKEVRLPGDPEILEALTILSDNNRYSDILAFH
jgi:carboxyl-terminal processing protease